MSKLSFSVMNARAEPYAAVCGRPDAGVSPADADATGEQIHAIALRCQIQIEPRQRHYSEAEEERLYELFGEPQRWGEALRTVLWTHATLMAPGFGRSD